MVNSNKMGNNGGRKYSFLNKPVQIDCQFKVSATDTGGLGIVAGSLKGAGVQNVFMHTSATPGSSNGYLNPNPASGFALIQLANNYFRMVDVYGMIQSPLSGSSLAINSTALTVGQPYVITSPGVASSGTVTIAPVADTAGSLNSTWFRLFDGYGNTFVLYFNVNGLGIAPQNTGGILVAVSIATGSTAAQVGAALVTAINALPVGLPYTSFTASGTTTVTVVSNQTNPIGPLPGVPSDGLIPTGFTFAQTIFNTNTKVWNQVGLPKGIVPAVGAAFVATSTGYSTGGGSTGTVQAPSVSSVDYVELVGDPNASIGPVPVGGSPNVGGWVMVQFLASTSSSVTTLIPTPPALGSVVNMSFMVEAGSILIQGQ